MKKILVAGASGFVGKALIEALLADADNEVIALSRRPRESTHPRLIWRVCDLFSLKDIRRSMEGCEYAYYLVHSMLPSAALSQGSFYDFDLLIADNFARAAKQYQLKQMIYLGGMIPEGTQLSWHLRSRLEVEDVLRASGVPVTTFRAGLIIGPNGSSFTILQKLVERLPIMICPSWTETLSQPLALKDAVRVLVHALGMSGVMNRIFDVGGKESLTYRELILKTAQLMGKKRRAFRLNLIPLSLSRLWVRFVSGVSSDLVYPLVLSLKYPMLIAPKHRWINPDDLSTSLDEAITIAVKGTIAPKSESLSTRNEPEARAVRSVQRMTLPPGKTAEWVAEKYLKWLPSLLPFALNAARIGAQSSIYFISPKFPLLILEKSEEMSSSDRQLLYIRGGFLAAKTERGRLEFREVLNRKHVLAAIHDYQPTLPWFIYRNTQARIHLIVMNRFARYLNGKALKS